MLHQLRCGGVLEASRIAAAGFPTRILIESFFQRYVRVLVFVLVCVLRRACAGMCVYMRVCLCVRARAGGVAFSLRSSSNGMYLCLFVFVFV